jgi:hypothetical protein
MHLTNKDHENIILFLRNNSIIQPAVDYIKTIIPDMEVDLHQGLDSTSVTIPSENSRFGHSITMVIQAKKYRLQRNYPDENEESVV